MDDVIKLIKQAYTKDTIGQGVPNESSREVFASINSVSRSEWSAAGVNGLKPSFVATTPSINYEGEMIVELSGERYSVYRTYLKKDSDEIELYLERKVGVSHG